MKIPSLNLPRFPLSPLSPFAIAAVLSALLLQACGNNESTSQLSFQETRSCPAWVAGQPYDVGAHVIYNGQAYVAVHANPGYDPTISTWFWKPAPQACSSSAAGIKPWAAGTPYNTGDKVMYQGACYVAEHPNPGYDPVISTWFWNPCEAGGTTTPGPATTGGTGLRSIISKDTFHRLFPQRNPFYTYEGLAAATDSMQGFAKEGSDEIRKREVAAFLANIHHETGGLQYVEEHAKGLYCEPRHDAPCAPGKRYYGRGPIQLSWNYNYANAGRYLGLDLLNHPDLVAQNSEVAWKTAMWFWMTSTGAGSMTAHAAILHSHGFGETIRAINGALECNGRNPSTVQSRIRLFLEFSRQIGVAPGGRLEC